MCGTILRGTNFGVPRFSRSLWTKILCLIILNIVNMPPDLYAQRNRIRFNHITIEQGLSHNSVYSIFQDSKGFMWFGTLVGLNKYDGYKFTVYTHDPDNPASLSHNAVMAIYEDRSGVLWIGTHAGGLNRFDRDTEQFIHYQHDPADPHSLGHNRVLSIYEDRSGTLWICTEGGGLNRFDRDTEQFIRYQHDPNDPKSLSGNNVTSFYEDQSGELWIGTHDGGLNRFDRDTGQFIRYQHDPADLQSLSSNWVDSFYEDPSGTLWVGNVGGLDRFDRDTGRFIHYRHDPADPHSLSENKIARMYEDHSGNLWIGTPGQGLNRFDRDAGQFIRYQYDPNDPQSLNDNRIRSMYRDRSGVLWIGTKTGGLNTYDRVAEQFLHYRHNRDDPQSLSHDVIYAIHEDRLGDFWIGTQGGGLNKLDRDTGQFVHYQYDPDKPQSLSDNDIRAIYEDRSGVLWIGTHDGGLNRFNRKTEQFIHYQYDPDDPQSLGSKDVSAIGEDHIGYLWVGGDGLDRFDRETQQFRHYRHDPDDPQSLSHNGVTCIYEDQFGVLWIGTSYGLNKFDSRSSWGETEQFHQYYHNPDDPQSLSGNHVRAIYEDGSGTLWVGTAEGLNKFDRANEIFTHYREKDGLPNDVIYGILEDDQGNLWLSTNQGISKFNSRTKTFKNYDVSDGLQGNEFNTNAYYKTRDGMMLFGGFNGFNAFYPERITDNPYIPPVVLTNFYLFNKLIRPGGDSLLQKPISETETLTLSYKDFIVSFEFAALSYVAPEKNQYAYIMEGFEKEWNYTDSTRRFVTYTNLDPGRYVFRVKAANNDGVWNEAGNSIIITITPPFWETWWFRGLMLVCLVGIVFAAHRMRVRTLESRKRQLERQVTERTQELQQEIVGRKRMEKALRESEELMHQVIDTTPTCIFVIDQDSKFILTNKLMADLRETTPEAMVGKTDLDYFHVSIASAKEVEKFLADNREVIDSKQPKFVPEESFTLPDGTVRWFQTTKIPLALKGNPDHLLGVAVDITEYKRAEEQIKAALAEKEVLLQEIHHRVKNNLQVVSNLLDFQSEYVRDARTLDMFKDCQNRVSSMALVHEQLYRSESLAKIDFASYIQSLTASLFDSFGAMAAAVTAKIDVEEVVLDIDTALTCGLIVNELVANALKYAFPTGKEGEIGIVFHSREDKRLTLMINDNGVGFPEDVDFRNTQSLGLQLVRMFTEQLDGIVELEKSGGTTFKITFPEPEQEEKELIQWQRRAS